MAVNVTNKLKNQRKSQYINKTFDDFRSELFQYARSNFSEQITDFSESSLGGMFLDFAAIVGDSLTFFVEQQFNELNYETATNTRNIESHLKKAGVKGGVASPSSVYVTFFIETDIDSADDFIIKPDPSYLPVIKKGTQLTSNSGITFILAEDVDFRKDYTQNILEVDESGIPLTLILEKKGLCTSGKVSTETVSFDSGDSDLFLSYALSNVDVQHVIKVVDNDLNEYYEVEFLSQDTVYLNVENSNENYLYPTPAPFRFIVENEYSSNAMLLRFGNGSGKMLQDSLLTNPEDFMLPIKNRSYNTNMSLDPNSLLNSNSLGVSPAGKTLTITYLHGGGTNHNVPSETIESVTNLIMVMPNISDDNVSIEDITADVESSLEVINEEKAVGGSNRLSLEELRLQIPNMITSQNRVVNEKDLISRIYTMPTNYGKVHKISIIENEYSNLSKDIYVICKDSAGDYAYANDALKKNLKNYINSFRLLGDSFNIVDSPIFNFSIDLTVKVKSSFIIEEVLDETISRIIQNMSFENLQINQAINVNDIINIVLNTDGVSSIVTIPENIVKAKSFQDNFFDDVDEIDIEYTENLFSSKNQFIDGFVYPLRGGIFELKYLDFDIVVRNG